MRSISSMLLMVTIFAVGCYFGDRGLLSVLPGFDTSDYNRTFRLIKRLHVKTDISDTDLFNGSLKGMVEGIGDPYSHYTDPVTTKVEAPHMAGEFAGIGAVLAKKKGFITVVSPIIDGPAAKAGLQTDDIITAVDGVNTSTLSFSQVILKIRGKIGTKVKLTVYREGNDEAIEIVITRGNIKTPSVKTKTVKKNGKTFMVVTLTSFDAKIEELFRKAAEKAVAEKMHGIVIDMRNNPGGYLHAARGIVCMWKNYTVAVSTETRDKAPDILSCTDDAILGNMLTAVLINKGSASASEIVAGALQDFRMGHVIGEQSYGKGSGQSIIDYPSGAQLVLTTFLWYTPNHRNINEVGITPDEVIETAYKDIGTEEDAQMNRALNYLSSGR